MFTQKKKQLDNEKKQVAIQAKKQGVTTYTK